MAERFEAAQADAEEAGVGIWKSNACGPAVDAPVEIVGLAGNPPGNDNEVLNEEWVRIRNSGDVPVDLTGWAMRDESASNRFAFPVGFTLAAAETATIYSGCGDNSAADLYWCSRGSAIWNNDGDTAFLLDPSGNVHHTYPYVPQATTTSSTTTTTSTTTTAPSTTTTTPSGNCDPAYPTVCIPSPPPDLDCGDIPHRRFEVLPPDPHGFDGNDNDGLGCES